MNTEILSNGFWRWAVRPTVLKEVVSSYLTFTVKGRSMKSVKQIAFFLTFTLCSILNFSVMGWDNPGHMAVAGLAYDELSAVEQGKLVALLKEHPGISLVTEGFPSGSPADRDFVMAFATWPDLAKRSPDYKENGYEANDPAITKVAFDHLMHKGWHFIDTPLWVGTGQASATLPTTPRVNAVAVVNILKTQLTSGETEAVKAYDIGWLLHLVGDLHQPLHAVTGVSEAFPKGDVGGNDILLQGVTRGESELHAYWDDILGKTAPSDKQTHLPRLDKDVATADEIITQIQGMPLGADADNVDPAAWAAESFKVAKQDAYAIDLKVTPGDRGSKVFATLDMSYGQTAARDAKQQIRLAGHRLALLLKPVLQ